MALKFSVLRQAFSNKRIEAINWRASGSEAADLQTQHWRGVMGCLQNGSTMLTFADIQAAAARLNGAVLQTPFVESRTLSQITGAQVYLKFENLQFTASFKERGALNKLLMLSDAERARGVVAMSAGNHAQGVAYHAQRLGLRAVIVMPRFTPGVKVERTRGFGAEVVLHGDTLAEARAHAYQLAQEQQLTFVHPYDDEAIAAGQGTLALEILQAQPDLDVLVIAIGGGGLIAGIATAAKAIKPEIEIVGVQTQRFPSMVNALRHTDLPMGTSTIAEGIAVTQPGVITQEVVQRCVDDLLLVDEGDIEQAVLMLLEIEKTLVEGAGAAGLAACCAIPSASRARRWGWCCRAAISTPCCWPPSSSAAWCAPVVWRACASARATCPACWPRSRPRWPVPAPISRKSTTSVPSPCWPRRTWRSSSCCRPAATPM
jgi:threonine dehydratase